MSKAQTHDTKDDSPQEVNTTFFEQKLFRNQEIQNGDSLVALQGMRNEQGIAKALRVTLEQGLDETNKPDLEWRRRAYGSNVPTVREPKTLLNFIMECLEDQMLQLLLAASAVSLIIGIIEDGLATGWIEGTAIFFAVFVVVSITAVNNYQKEQQFLKLSLENAKKDVKVRRNGKDKNISVDDLLVGDVLKVEIGNIMPVDAIMIEGQVEIDESAMNGENDIMKKVPSDKIDFKDKKNKMNPFCVSGTSVKGGDGYALVCAVGSHSQMGITKKLLNKEDENTPLQDKLDDLADKIGEFGFYSAAMIFVAIVFKDIVSRMYYGRPIFSSTLLDTVLNGFIVGITVIVVAIPEGLPMAVTISLAYSVFKMKEEKNLVRRIEAGETMGGVDTICSDKTGTLTEGTMKIVEVYVEGQIFETNQFKLKNVAQQQIKDINRFYRGLLKNMDAVAEKVPNKQEIEVKGNMTDSAMLRFLLDCNCDIKAYEDEKKQKVLPFDSAYKFMSTITERKGEWTMYLKGAPEFLISQGRISHYATRDGTHVFDDKAVEEYKRIQDEFADKTYRTILICSKTITPKEVEAFTEPKKEIWDQGDQLRNFTIVAMVAIMDPPRPGVEDSIKILQNKSGIKVRMVTGDNIRTAIAISDRIGILRKDEFTAARNYAIDKMKIDEDRKQIEDHIKEKKQAEGRLSKESASDLRAVQSEITALNLKLSELDEKRRNLESKPLYALEGSDFRRLVGGYKEEKPTEEELKKEEEERKKLKEDDDKEEKVERPKKFVLNDKEAFKRYTKDLKVIARASPDDKFLMVIGLKEIGSVVAVTGDGTNDAPALKASDVGFSMGKRGTDIAKDASHIILLEESFTSIVTAVKYGRNVYDCIRKFLQFQLTTNCVAVFMTLLGAIVLKDAPLNAIQMLWLNLIMDSFGSLALATEPPKDELLDRRPYKRSESPLTSMMMFNIVSQAIFQILVLTVILFYGDIIFNVPSDRELSHFEWNNVNGYHFTIFFHIFVMLQVFNSVNARKLKKSETNVFEGIFNNNLYVMIQSAIVVCQILIVTFGGRALRVKSLSISQHFLCILIASLTLPIGWICKKLPYNLEPEDDTQQDTASGYKRSLSKIGISGGSIRKSIRGGLKSNDGGSKGQSFMMGAIKNAQNK